MKTQRFLRIAVVVGMALGGTCSWGDEPPVPSQPSAPGGESVSWGGGVGTVSVDGKTYFMVAIRPELTFGLVAIGMDLRVLWNDDGIRREDWDEAKDFANLFRYIRYAQKGASPVYAKIGTIDTATLGYGFIMRRYNNLGFTGFDRKFGAEFDMDFTDYGFETVTNDLTTLRLFGARGYLRPLRGMGAPIISSFEVGATYVTDREPHTGKTVLSGTTIIPAPAQSALTSIGADAGAKIVDSDFFSMKVYGAYSRIEGQGDGWVIPGFLGKLLVFDYRFENRNFAPNFIASPFDFNYEDRRPIDWTLAQYDPTKPRVTGWFGELNWTFDNIVAVSGYYEQYTGTDPNVHGEAKYIGKFIPKVSEASIAYDQKAVKTLSLQDPNTSVVARLGYELAPNASLVYVIRQTYDVPTKTFKRTSTMETAIKF